MIVKNYGDFWSDLASGALKFVDGGIKAEIGGGGGGGSLTPAQAAAAAQAEQAAKDQAAQSKLITYGMFGAGALVLVYLVAQRK